MSDVNRRDIVFAELILDKCNLTQEVFGKRVEQLAGYLTEVRSGYEEVIAQLKEMKGDYLTEVRSGCEEVIAQLKEIKESRDE